MNVTAPAKVNLTLRVLGKCDDGYHALESVMQMLTLTDTLSIEDADDLIFTCSVPELAGPENLVSRAAHILRAYCPVPRGAAVHLEKRIPMQAGLGGGSSDAAAALLALNEFWDLRLPLETLSTIAARLGSDVPFFLDGPCAIACGRGEVLTPVVHEISCSVVLAKPEAGLPTPEVYRALQASPIPTAPPEKTHETMRMLRALASGDPGMIAEALVNDLQVPAFHLLPELARLRDRMRAVGCLGVVLCGSGSCLCGICADAVTANHAAIDLTNDAPWTWAGKLLAFR